MVNEVNFKVPKCNLMTQIHKEGENVEYFNTSDNRSFCKILRFYTSLFKKNTNFHIENKFEISPVFQQN
jgi:hypothetical protein